MNLKLGFRTITVLPMPELDQERHVAWGDFCGAKSVIRVSPRVSPEEQGRILIHELLHACWWYAALPNKCREERVCEGLDRGLASLLQANPELFAVLHMALSGQRGIFDQVTAKPTKRRKAA
jgi:hypothetical protein